ncbi:hypothetical protein [Aeromonas veronii]|uniref:hypothetical protein n=1 Tax=Aeromonas veronii TaxID=654 RepID=UPI001F16D6D9|nr:hypothetical protein [Aeromonas veronii]MCF7744317.1 hypothetical protein [Aeromonas veronii]
MAKVPFTIRELQKASRSGNKAANSESRENHHLLLLFYAVECGLKAVVLRRAGKTVIDQTIASAFAHDINGILSDLRVSKDFFLPQNMSIEPIRDENGSTMQRQFTCGELNQVWRYGASMDEDTTRQVEGKLDSIMQWIQQEF